LLCNPYTFVNAYTAISKNKGALTKGIDPEETIASYFGLINAENIAKRFPTNFYQWKPVRRVWIPKPGKKTTQPIDTPIQEDRIVQEAILR
jgi:RNA-directed DNA polymerase